MERKVCFISDADSEGRGVAGSEAGLLSKGQLPTTDNQWARAFIDRGRGYMQKQHSQL